MPAQHVEDLIAVVMDMRVVNELIHTDDGRDAEFACGGRIRRGQEAEIAAPLAELKAVFRL